MIFKLCDKCLKVMNGKSYTLSLIKNQSIIDTMDTVPYEFEICEECYQEIITTCAKRIGNVKIIFENN